MTRTPSADIQDLRAGLGVYAVIFVMKLSSWLSSGVMAVFGEALHTRSDLAIPAFRFAAAVGSRKSADELHPFGHGRAQNAPALAAAALFVSFTSDTFYVEAVPRLVALIEAPTRNRFLAEAALVASMVLTAVRLLCLRRRADRESRGVHVDPAPAAPPSEKSPRIPPSSE